MLTLIWPGCLKATLISALLFDNNTRPPNRTSTIGGVFVSLWSLYRIPMPVTTALASGPVPCHECDVPSFICHLTIPLIMAEVISTSHSKRLMAVPDGKRWHIPVCGI
jgi:hypothetical protein